MTRPSSPIHGKWRIIEMENGDRDYFDIEVPAYFLFRADGAGEFQFGLVQGGIDGRLTTREGQPAVEFTWGGIDEMDPVTGRGWAMVDPKGKLQGRIFIHDGEESGFTAKKSPSQKRPRK